MIEISAIALLVTAIIFGLSVLLPRNITKAIGWHLQRKTRTRKGLILKRVEAEQQAFSFPKVRSSPKSDDEDWEKVESSVSIGNLQNDEDLEGIIGFFHPFWYVFHFIPFDSQTSNYRVKK